MHPLLTDFGIARLADSPGLTRTSEFVGTPAYVAPESAEGRPQTSAVDVYGAGILLYELVTGRPPFSGGSALEVLHQHLSAEPRRPSTVPDPLWTVIERCLRKNPDDRPSAENLARGLRIVAEGIGVHANSMQIAAADGVGHLLAPDPTPATVPGGAYDPNAATSVLPHAAGPAGAADPTAVLPHTGGPHGSADPTAVLPPVPPHQPDGQGGPQQPEQPHPWQNQMRAARDRNEPTQVQQYLDPGDDPLRRRPQRQVSRPQQQSPQPQQPYRQQPPQRPQQSGYGYPGQQQPQQRYAAPQPQQPQQPQRHAPAPQQQPRQRPAPEPRQPREPRQRSANPMRIPGLGCLKGCLFTIVILFVAGWLIWELSPLQDWIGSGRTFWGQVTHWYDQVAGWIGDLGGGTGN
jgi:serine/threonine-protein kinase